MIRVRDNGIGIPPEQLEHVFEIFSQVNRTLDRSRGGLGIGLALVRQLVEMHGGHVRASSAGAGTGTTLEIRLPLAAPVARDEPETRAVVQPSEPITANRVLVVDDNDDAAE